ncbi:MAG: prepilin peptidase [Lachnospiraceae bacterium]|nr:prepilin peptidase [Lachnospiraceae bacterium]
MSLFLGLITVVFLVICTVTDLKERVVYLRILLPFMFAGILFQLLSGNRSLWDILGGMLVGGGLLFLNLATGGHIGYGDGLVVMVTGCFLGLFGNLRLLMGGVMLAGVFSGIMLVLRHCGRKTEIPFVPFLLASFLLL